MKAVFLLFAVVLVCWGMPREFDEVEERYSTDLEAFLLNQEDLENMAAEDVSTEIQAQPIMDNSNLRLRPEAVIGFILAVSIPIFLLIGCISLAVSHFRSKLCKMGRPPAMYYRNEEDDPYY